MKYLQVLSTENEYLQVLSTENEIFASAFHGK